MTTSHQVALGSLVQEWTQMVRRSPQGVRLVSPYLTDPIASKVLRAAERKSTVVITRFSVEDFARRASSIDTVETLLSRKITIIHVANLHAKVLLTAGKATIGSQNTTRGSEGNMEAGVILSAAEDLEKVRTWVQELVDTGHRVSIQMVKHARTAIKELSHLYDEATALTEVQQYKIVEADCRRKIANARRVAISRTRSIEEQILDEHNVSFPKRVRLTRIDPSYDWRRASSEPSPSYFTMKAPVGSNLLNWAFPDNNRKTLSSQSRYLLLDAVTRRLGWLRVYRTQLTKIGTGLLLGSPADALGELRSSSNELIPWADQPWTRASINLDKPSHPSNVSMILESDDSKLLFRFRFDLSGCTFIKADREIKTRLDSLSKKSSVQLAKFARSGGLNEWLEGNITSSFSYTHNRLGIEPNDFFEEPWHNPPQSLRLIDRGAGHYIIVAFR